jgi:hypothetical protein
MGRVRGYTKRNGTRVRAYVRGDRAKAEHDQGAVKAGHDPGTVKKVVLTAALALGGATVSVTLFLGISGGASPPGEGGTGSQPHARASTEAEIDFSHARATLVAHGYRVALATNVTKDCAGHSHGQVHSFFLSNPCSSLMRASLVLDGTDAHNPVLVALSWVAMPSAAAAKQYSELVTGKDTGDVNELSRESGPYVNVRFTGQFFDSGLDGQGVWEAQVQPIGKLETSAVNAILQYCRQ